MFFEVKEMVYEDLNDKMHNIISEVSDIAVSLDKVTIRNKTYMLILTYYFHGGVIHCLLSKLFIMHSTDGDALGTAELVIFILIETLKMTNLS